MFLFLQQIFGKRFNWAIPFPSRCSLHGEMRLLARSNSNQNFTLSGFYAFPLLQRIFPNEPIGWNKPPLNRKTDQFFLLTAFLGAITAPGLLAVLHAQSVQSPTDHLISHPRQVADTAPPDKDDRVLL